MTGVLGAAQLFVLTAALFTVAIATLSAVATPWLRQRLRRVAPARRARAFGWLTAAPAALGLGMALICFVPGVLGQFWPELDHCLTHSHAASMHLCFGHLPGGTGTALGWLLVAAYVGWLAVPTGRRLLAIRRSRRLLRQLVASARPGAAPDVLMVESPQPLALATGVSPRVLISRGLIDALEPQMLDVVLAHERAHLRRRDPRRRTLATLLAAAHFPATRRALLAELELASEQACDEAAADALGDRVLVARALIAVERLSSRHPGRLGCAAHAFGASHLAARVDALLAPPTWGSIRPWPRGTAWAMGLGLIALTGPLHHAAEHLIALLR